MKNLIIIVLLLISVHCYSQSPEVAIQAVMDNQAKSWNKGDLEGFMKGYWESDKLVFIGSKGLTYGWKQTLENYKKSYPTTEKMGKLKFDIKSIEPLSDDYWFVIGKWSLDRNEQDLEGHFSLLWRNIEREWVIVADHSS